MKEINEPPKLFLRFFRWFCHPDLQKYVEGDLMELYEERVAEIGKRRADIKFILDVLLLFRPGIIRAPNGFENFNDFAMVRNYLIIGIRNILKYKTFSFINIFGLAAAMSVCMLIILMLTDQNRYDQFNKKKDRIYRVLSDGKDFRLAYATTPYPLADALKTEYSVAEETTNLSPRIGGDATYNERIAEMRGYFASPSFFRVFSFELESGNKFTALESPNSMVISREVADRLFPGVSPLGKVLEFSDRQLPFPQDFDGVSAASVLWGAFTVTGVLDESRYKSHLKFDVLVSSSTRERLIAEKRIEDLSGKWEWYYNTYTYVLLDSNKNREDLDRALAQLVSKKYKDIKLEQTAGFKLKEQALSDVQLNLMSNDTNNRLPLIGYYFLSFLAIIIMGSACLNYTNLSTARALTRAKEIGVRKVTGANKSTLALQFLSESVLTSLFALMMAILFLFFLARAFKNLWVNQYLDFELPSSVSAYLIFVVFSVFIGILAGVYPAWYLSRYQPIMALKSLAAKTGRLNIRKTLTVTQFVISLFFITTSILIFNQFKYFMTFDYGFNTKQIVNVDLQGVEYNKIANELTTLPQVINVSACDVIPAGGRRNGDGVRKAGTKDAFANASLFTIDENFLSNLGIPLIAGRNFSPLDRSGKLILVNEKMIKKLGFTRPGELLGQTVETEWGKERFEIIGVVDNFHYDMLVSAREIAPMIIRNQGSSFMYANVKINSTNVGETITKLEAVWKRLDPVHPFKYRFYDDQLAGTNRGIFDLVSILGFISFLAITIACLGLLGIAIYAVERRKKEVGIRKVLGAGEFGLTVLLSKEFLKMLALSIAIAAPMSFFVNNLWLHEMPYRVEFGWEIMLAATSTLLFLGLLTIGTQTVSAAKRNPVDSLRME
jgi:putative ABC transport system permease protein